MKVIPAIDIMENQVVRLVRGDPENKTVYSNDPVGIAKKWEGAGADMLHVVDLDATLGRGSNLDTMKKIARHVSIPVQVAGGLRSEEIVEDVLAHASKVVVGTIAFQNQEILQRISKRFGKSRVVISTDQMGGQIVVGGWKEGTGIELIPAIERFVNLGYSEFLLTSVDRDGTLRGPDLVSLKNACAVRDARIIASGGISSVQDAIDVKQTGAYGIILGKALYDGRISVEEVKSIS